MCEDELTLACLRYMIIILWLLNCFLRKFLRKKICLGNCTEKLYLYFEIKCNVIHFIFIPK